MRAIHGVVGLLAAAVIAGDAAAQVPTMSPAKRSTPTGFQLGLGLSGSSIKFEDQDDTESGGGFGFQLGWGFTPNILVYLAGQAAVHEQEALTSSGEKGEYILGHGDLGLRWHFLAGRRWVPYADVAFTTRQMSGELEQPGGEKEDVEITGEGGLSVGGGVQFFVSPRFAVDANLKFSGGKFTEQKIGSTKTDIDMSATSSRLFVGISWFPMGK